ncbi:MAG: DUF5985 family protein [Telluria sp.]
MMIDSAIPYLQGMIAMASGVIALFFVRFWHSSRDRFFLWFALSFLIEAGHRTYLGLELSAREDTPWHYLLRVLSYGLILLAIWEKNRPARGRPD